MLRRNTSKKRTGDEVDEENSKEKTYIITLYHHKETLDYFNEYFVEQIKTIKKYFMCGKITTRIISSNPNFFVSHIPEQKPMVFHHLKSDNEELNNFQIEYNYWEFEKDNLKFELYQILPFESKLLKMVVLTSDIDDYIKNTKNFAHNAIGTKRYFAQKLIYDKIQTDKTQKFHLQIDYGTVLGISPYINEIEPINNLKTNLKDNYRFHLLTNELMRSNVIDVKPRDKIIYKYCEDSNCEINDVNIANYDMLLFLLYYNNRYNYIDHMGITEPQVSKNNCSYYNANCKKMLKDQIESLKATQSQLFLGPQESDRRMGTTMAPKMSHAKKESDVTLGGHYNKFYITNMNSTYNMKLYYDPFKQFHWEDVDFTYKMIKNGLVIMSFWLYTWTICKKTEIQSQQEIQTEPQDCSFMKINQYIFPKLENYGDIAKDVNISVLDGGNIHPLSRQCSLSLKSSQSSAYGVLDKFLYENIENSDFTTYKNENKNIDEYIKIYHSYNNAEYYKLNTNEIIKMCINKIKYVCTNYKISELCGIYQNNIYDNITDFMFKFDEKFNNFLQKYCISYLLNRIRKINADHIKITAKIKKTTLSQLTDEDIFQNFDSYFSNFPKYIVDLVDDKLKLNVKNVLKNPSKLYEGGYLYSKYIKYMNKNVRK